MLKVKKLCTRSWCTILIALGAFYAKEFIYRRVAYKPHWREACSLSQQGPEYTVEWFLQNSKLSVNRFLSELWIIKVVKALKRCCKVQNFALPWSAFALATVFFKSPHNDILAFGSTEFIWHTPRLFLFNFTRSDFNTNKFTH